MFEADFTPDDILYEDNHLLAINKRGGVLTQGDDTRDKTARDILIDYIKVRDNKPGNVYLHPAHRLDRPVSGVLLFSKTSKALPRLHTLFRERKVTKTYIALTEAGGKRPEPLSIVEGYIRKNRAQGRVSFKKESFPDGKYSKTTIEWLFQDGDLHGFRLTPETGRPHQLRVHLFSQGYSICNDVRYGASERHQGFIHLHAHTLSFEHPVKKEPLEIIAPIPQIGLWPDYIKSFQV